MSRKVDFVLAFAFIIAGVATFKAGNYMGTAFVAVIGLVWNLWFASRSTINNFFAIVFLFATIGSMYLAEKDALDYGKKHPEKKSYSSPPDEETVQLPASLDELYFRMKSLKFLTLLKTKQSEWPKKIQQLTKYSMPSLVYGRPLNKVMIIMVGQSGTGKSTTINTLFADNICSTSSDKSETREVTEYGKELCVRSESPAVSATLSFVDLPGALDVDHTKEAQNLAAIKRFRDETMDLTARHVGKLHESLNSFKIREQVYPNMILMTVKASDNRMVGPDSNLQKSLKMLDEYQMVDKVNVNLVVVVTHAMSIPSKKFKERTNQIRKNIYEAVYEVLRITNIEVVFVENMPDDYDMVKTEGSDFYTLPDGQMSHYNLIVAMVDQFKKNDDLLGRLLCGWYFADSCPEKENRPNIIHSVKHFTLSSDELRQAQHSLHSIGVQAASSANDLPELQFHVLGRGYNPRGESMTQASVLRADGTAQVEVLGKKYKIANIIQLHERKENHFHRLSMATRKMYENYKAASYGLDGDIVLNVNAHSRGRWVNENDKSVSKTSSLSFLYETRLMNAKIGDVEHVKKHLITVLEQLPDWYDPENTEQFHGFFSRWGTHFVCEVWIGGALKIDAMAQVSNFTEDIGLDIDNQLQIVLTLIGTGKTYSMKDVGIQNEILTITGGNPPHVTTLSDLTSHQFADWTESVSRAPSELENSVKLYPYYNLAPEGRQREALREATMEYLAGSISPPAVARRNNVAKQIIEEVKQEEASQESCFPVTAKIYTRKGLVPINELTNEDRLLTITDTSTLNENVVTFTEFLAYLHYDPEMIAEFLIFHLDNNETLTISPNHLVFANEDGWLKSVLANQIIIGKDLVFVDGSNNENYSKLVRVMHISKTVMKGVYAPLTDEGTLIVDGVLVSCYASVNSHLVAHVSMTPLRLWYKVNAVLTSINGALYTILSDIGKYFGLSSYHQRQNMQTPGIHMYAELLVAIRSIFL